MSYFLIHNSISTSTTFQRHVPATPVLRSGTNLRWRLQDHLWGFSSTHQILVQNGESTFWFLFESTKVEIRRLSLSRYSGFEPGDFIWSHAQFRRAWSTSLMPPRDTRAGYRGHRTLDRRIEPSIRCSLGERTCGGREIGPHAEDRGTRPRIFRRMLFF